MESSEVLPDEKKGSGQRLLHETEHFSIVHLPSSDVKGVNPIGLLLDD